MYKPAMVSTIVLGILLSLAAGAQEELRGIPLKPDPPFDIDGDLSDWAGVPNTLTLDRAEQVVWGGGAWESPKDMRGTVHIAWRQGNLFLAAAVTDDRLAQAQRSGNLWKGDHVELYLDLTPEEDPKRDTLGEGQFQLGLSPGNFLDTGDPFTDCPPEACCFFPQGVDTSTIVVASQRTEAGWTLEAAVPWDIFGVALPARGRLLRYEIALSDTDTTEPQQQSLMTTRTDAWGRKRSRYALAALAASDGVPPPRAQRIPVFDALTLQRGESQTFTFAAPPVPEGKDACVGLEARLHSSKVAGYTPALRVSLNGQRLGRDRVINRPLRAKARDGRVCSLIADDRFATFYTPDFESPDTHARYGLLDGIKACTFEFDVTDLLRQAGNELLVEHTAAASVDNPLIAAAGRLSFRSPPPPPKPKAGPPTGPLPTIEPRTTHAVDYTVEEGPNAALALSFGGESFQVESRFSSPTPAWVQGSCDYFEHARRIERKPEALVVYDTFTNRTDKNLGVMQRHSVVFGKRLKRVWIGGLAQSGLNASNAVNSNPTTFGAGERIGVGVVALNDALRIHATNFAMDGAIGLADNNLVLAPGASYTAEWAIVPTEAPDYWRFINAVRRLVDANFRLPGAFAFIHARSITEEWSDQQVTDFLRFKDAYYACTSIVHPRYKGRHYTHGTSFQHVTHDNYREGIDRWRGLVPDAKYLVYYHCFIDPLDEAPQRFEDARTLRPDGTQNDYGKPAMRLFFPTETNTYGQEAAKSVDIIFDEIGADGVYWDEHAYSRAPYHFGAPWDGLSGDIDARTMRVARLKSSVCLLSRDWRAALAKRILARGPLVGNGSPRTRAMAALKFPCFHETGSITNCTKSHLHSPIALGDHLTERSELHAYETMLAALDYGCVYHWYAQSHVVPTHHHLTRYMYPITPIELHEGYLLGEERIVTKRSGLYGWGDTSAHEVHVFDDTGREVRDFDAPLIKKDGKTFTELRIGEDWSAAIIRR